MKRKAITSWMVVMLCICQMALLGEKVELPQGEEAMVNGCFNAPGDSRLLGWRLRSGGLGTFELTEPQACNITVELVLADLDPDKFFLLCLILQHFVELRDDITGRDSLRRRGTRKHCRHGHQGKGGKDKETLHICKN